MLYPHCDSWVLHAPGVCIYCDQHPDWQQARIRDGINFTGENEEGKAPCPADAARGDRHMEWVGNVARDREGNPVIPPPAAQDIAAAATTILEILEQDD